WLAALLLNSTSTSIQRKHWRKNLCLPPWNLVKVENCKARPLEAGLRPTGVAETVRSRHCLLCRRRKRPLPLLFSNIWPGLAYCIVEGGAAMSMFPHVVTLYNADTEERPETGFEPTLVNHITILRGVLLH